MQGKPKKTAIFLPSQEDVPDFAISQFAIRYLPAAYEAPHNISSNQFS